ncbi:hypothetical protein AB4Y89_23465 [Terriglobus sp. 2YAB30_2]|uniref:hypothetical protein n=2 Tax=unclassified Terriglobus TaxID=2628988 RepID=UPI003F9A77BE
MQRPHGITAIMVVHSLLYIEELIFANWTIKAHLLSLVGDALGVVLVMVLWKGRNTARQLYVLLALLYIFISPLLIMQQSLLKSRIFIAALTAFYVIAIVYLDTVKVRQWYGAGDWSILRFWKFSPKASVPAQPAPAPKSSAYSGLASPGL